ncbi:hypothetical protein [Hyphomicrobium sp.]|uniref:hypothetical protein n=1 Tax=Hyphomicrobium sp. TaxID=82 RepID=UPI00356990E2
MTDQPSPFRALLGSRILQFFAVLAAAIGIFGEGVVVFTNYENSKIQLETARNAERAQRAAADQAEVAVTQAKISACNETSKFILDNTPMDQVNDKLKQLAANCGWQPQHTAASDTESPAFKEALAKAEKQNADLLADTPNLLRRQEQALPAIEAADIQEFGKPARKTAIQLAGIAFNALGVGDFPKALNAATRAHDILPTDLKIESTRAIALLLNDRKADADAIIDAHHGQTVQVDKDYSEPWAQHVSFSLGLLKELHVTTPATEALDRKMATENTQGICAQERAKGKDEEFLRALGCL